MKYQDINKKFYRVSYTENGEVRETFYTDRGDAENRGLYLSKFKDVEIYVTTLEFHNFLEKEELTLSKNYRSVESYG